MRKAFFGILMCLLVASATSCALRIRDVGSPATGLLSLFFSYLSSFRLSDFQTAVPSKFLKDGAGNLYVLGQASLTANGYNRVVVRRFDGVSWSTIGDFPNSAMNDPVGYGGMTHDALGNILIDSIETNSSVLHLILRGWDGTQWNVVTDLPLTGIAMAVYPSVSRNAVTGDYFVTGYENAPAGVNHWMVRKWNGVAWSVSDDFLYGGTNSAQATGITYDPVGNIYICGWASGVSGNGEHWLVRKFNGVSWSTFDDFTFNYTGTGVGEVHAERVYSDGAGNIYAVGYGWDNSTNNRYHWLVRRWNGTAWSTDDNYQLSAGSDARGLSLGIDASNNIYVAGYALDASSLNHWTVRIRNSGTGLWSMANDYQLNTANGSSGHNISVISGAEIYVAGEGYDAACYTFTAGTSAQCYDHWLVRKWNGTAWSNIEDYRPTGDGNTSGTGITRSPSGLIYSIGTATNSSDRWVVRTFDGTNWTTSDSFMFGHYSYPLGLAADSNNNVYVAGIGSPGFDSWIVRQWNGTSWSTLETLTSTCGANHAYGVAVDSLNNVYVTGNIVDNTCAGHWYVRKYNGATWTLHMDYALTNGWNTWQNAGIAIDSTDKIYAVGMEKDASLVAQWLVRKYDGAAWSTIDTFKYAPGQGSAATSVSIRSPNEIYVAGYGADSSGISHWLVRKWNGTGWATVDDFQWVAGKLSSATAISVDAATGYIYVTGTAQDAGGNSFQLVRKWDGGSWSVIEQLPAAYSYNLGILAAPGGSVYYTGSERIDATHHNWVIKQH